MHYKALSLGCDCGGRLAPRIREIGLSPEHQLVIQWWCPSCRRTHYTVKALSDCWRDCPGPEEHVKTAGGGVLGTLEPDALFLHSLGVALPEDDLC
jgi:hypothetical protein